MVKKKVKKKIAVKKSSTSNSKKVRKKAGQKKRSKSKNDLRLEKLDAVAPLSPEDKATIKKASRKAIPSDRGKGGKFLKGNQAGHRFTSKTALSVQKRVKVSRNPLTSALKFFLNWPAHKMPMTKKFLKDHNVKEMFDNKADYHSLLVSDVVGMMQIAQSLDGEAGYMKEMFNRVEGKVPDHLITDTNSKMSMTEVVGAVKKNKKAV